MKYLVLMLLGLAMSTRGNAQPEASTAFAKNFGPKWERAKAYTLAVAEAMPEDAYNYRPTDDVFTFGEQMTHVIGNMRWICSSKVLEQPSDFDRSYWIEQSAARSKAEILAELAATFDYVHEALMTCTDAQLQATVAFRGQRQRKDLFHVMRNHATHHRGQAVVYLRMKGITPPQGVWW